MPIFLAKLRRTVKIVECGEMTVEADTLDNAKSKVSDMMKDNETVIVWNEDDVSESEQIGDVEIASVEAIATGNEVIE